MAAFSALALGLAIGGIGGMLLHRKKKDGVAAPGPVAPEVKTPAEQVAATNPPDTAAMESENTATAGSVAARTRRRAKAGNAGPVGSISASQAGTSSGGAPRSLLGS